MEGPDVKNLFHSFGGASNSYKELGKEHETKEAHGRWPLLQSISTITSSASRHGLDISSPHQLLLPV